jgi:FKBP-type peptidyl-prolyl cis-trans isomerase SlyD
MIPSGYTVRIHYTLTVGGRLVDSSAGGEPLSYIHGMGQIVPGLEEQVGTMGAGDKRTVSIGPDKGYGAVDPGAFVKVPREAFKDLEGLEPGVFVRGRRGEKEFSALVAEVGEDSVMLDLNHPLAGKTLDFEIEVVEVRPPSA